ncbi:GNAT family N-acetyltransferase [Saprospira sp. CCB-QB6]|uniref:GNAT family N-acetyltransferase n=1 Tax=Saprospira sp. CCB-QB6 TaxID=3023936 RepID=UPI00234A54D2|nr:GNAT family N-acetyltransferase [Saprospira sp. CCB-QB6]WCL83032.1 GNAT family N-acetyltransferase [Saprospira sp. CCB-QB6]
MSYFKPFPMLQNDQLLLRYMEEEDARALFQLRSDAEQMRYVNRPLHQSEAESLAHIEMLQEHIETGKSISWAISLPGHPRMLGAICLFSFSDDRKEAEVGYELHPNVQRQGLMKAALKLVLEYANEQLGLRYVHAHTHRDNEASKRLLAHYQFRILGASPIEQDSFWYRKQL